MKKIRARIREPEAVRELHRMRARILRKAQRVGIADYYLGLNQRPELILSADASKAQVMAESSTPYRASVREPQAVREVHEWRRKIQGEMERLGTDEYVRRLNRRAAELLTSPKNRKRAGSRD